MKTNELMIGDWVVYDGDTNYICPMQIEGMDIATDSLITSDRDDVGFDGVQPIPITPEILEKNGWEKRPTGYVFYTDGKRYDNSLWYIFGSNTFVVNTAEFQIKYVHELQHALRLCGIDKMIEL